VQEPANPARPFRVVLDTPDGRRAIECGAGEFIWDAAVDAGIALPALCHRGWCLTCAARLVEGEVDQSASVSYLPADREAGFVLPCTGRPRTDLVLLTHRQSEMRDFRRAHGMPAPYS
jgi:ferredoxin